MPRIPAPSKRIYTQRRSNDCGVAALASLLGCSYEDVYVAAVKMSPAFRKRDGLSIPNLLKMASALGAPLTRVHYRKVDLYLHSGILGVNWDQRDWKKRGCTGHWVVLHQGTIIDPADSSYSDAATYLHAHRGRAGTLLAR